MTSRAFRYDTQIRFAENSLRPLNPEFSLCDVLVLYHGDNRNGTHIAKQVVENAAHTLYGVPIVGEWCKRDDGSETWGSHGGRIILDDQGIRFEQTTKALGFVTQEAVEKREWVTITEKDGHTQHEYLKLSGCILWTKRVEEAQSILDQNFGQSMEVQFPKGYTREDGVFVAEDMIFSALCVLGTAQPCFESARIGRHFAYDAFKSDYRRMMARFEALTGQAPGMEVEGMNKEKNPALDEKNPAPAQPEGQANPPEGGNADSYEKVVAELNDKILALEEKYAALEVQYAEANAQIEQHKADQAAAQAAAHTQAVDSLVAGYSEKMGKYTEYLLYRSRIDYGKTLEQVQQDMTLLMGRYAEGKAHKGQKASFELSETRAPKAQTAFGENDRYGGILDRFAAKNQ